MAKRVFFSFHYKDVSDFGANVVRNHWQMKPNREICGYYDASIWEAAQKQGDVALNKLRLRPNFQHLRVNWKSNL